jgi:FAD/FMN-containing dehydrogenase
LRILGDTRTPFAVKGGGHATNPGFSSTPGVQISMTRFNTTTVDRTAKTVAIGAGLLWDDVYSALDGTGLNVVGGRVRGVGVAGFILGGGVWSFSHLTVFWLLMDVLGDAKGYSWKTSQFGLTIDTVVSFELVLPDGTIRTVTAQDEDLWFGLRVCHIVIPFLSKLRAKFSIRVASTTLYVDSHDTVAYPNLVHIPQGIVTNFVLNAHPQGEVWVTVFFLGCSLRTQLD